MKMVLTCLSSTADFDVLTASSGKRRLTSCDGVKSLLKMAARKEIQIRWPFRKLRAHPLLNGMVGELALSREPVSVGWGYRGSGRAAGKISQKRGIPLLLLEDAFLRSMRPGIGQIYGLVADSQGIYYDCSGKSDLVASLNSGNPKAGCGLQPLRI
ncbi:MAG: hypothetical protein HC767_07495 [Akkermansiaceae bacterium]|nr:hypothetical protein [Akkermansiaceae bacterium]